MVQSISAAMSSGLLVSLLIKAGAMIEADEVKPAVGVLPRCGQLTSASRGAEERAYRYVIEHGQAGKRPHDLKRACDAEQGAAKPGQSVDRFSFE